MNQPYPVRVGELRPSQLLWAYGCGSLVDLPQVSVVVMGLNFWDPTSCLPVGEDRLLGAVRRVLGPQVAAKYDFELRGYRVIGMSGWKPLRGDYALPSLRPRRLGGFVARLTEPFATRLPKHAFQLLALRDMEAS